MTYPTINGRRRATLPAALAALALGGCSATHVGDAWQCPLAQGTACESVAAADPAVPGAAEGTRILREPLYLPRAGGDQETSDAGPVSGRGCEAGGFDLFGWLAKPFGAGGEAGVEPPPAAESPVPAADSAVNSPAAGPAPPDLAAPEAAGLPAGEEMDDLRTGEIVARIWIAPFVDADGVYREAGHVRAVLEPAGWRIP